MLKFRSTILSATCLTLIASPICIAGPIDPPAGDIAPTNKTLLEIEPRIAIGPKTTPGGASSVYQITAPGSYYLTERVVGEAGKHGIEIVVGNVTIDLNGFEVIGLPGSLAGVFMAGGTEHIAVASGAVRNWGTSGVDVTGAAQANVSDIHAIGNALEGIRVGNKSVVNDCITTANGRAGISAAGSSVISRCVASENALDGISVDATGIITGCVVTANGEDGIDTGPRSTVSDCFSPENGRHGIVAKRDGRVLNNNCTRNGEDPLIADGAGVFANGGNVFVDEGNLVTSNDVGVAVSTDGGCIVVKNVARRNGVAFDLPGSHVFGSIDTATGEIVTVNPWATFAE